MEAAAGKERAFTLAQTSGRAWAGSWNQYGKTGLSSTLGVGQGLHQVSALHWCLGALPPHSPWPGANQVNSFVMSLVGPGGLRCVWDIWGRKLYFWAPSPVIFLGPMRAWLPAMCILGVCSALSQATPKREESLCIEGGSLLGWRGVVQAAAWLRRPIHKGQS